ncbi:fused MFS/spermidine synthase [Patescibacteria group bacterium]|nr:fused MFS/spermidine synthase [Patescibacteria group bacterium]MBU1922259.1 fused MFS/spermidine synthase [Patescibacteria group bacterium]
MPRFKHKYIFFVAFCVGMCIMAIELTAARLLAPYFGTSLFVWTNVIAIIMIALSVGYYLGGRLSERRHDISLLLKIIIFAGLLSFIIPFIIQPVALHVLKDFGAMSRASVVILFGSFLVTSFLFFAPIMFLGMVSPFLIKVLSLTKKDAGAAAGSIFAVSTVGSIVGTFLPSLVFIPWVGSKKTILIFALVLIFVAVFGLARRKKYVWLAALFLLIGPFAISQDLRHEQNTALETESAYQYIRVLENQGMRQLVYNEGMGIQSVYAPDKVMTGHMYFDVMAAAPALLESNDIRVLNIGLAGGTVVRSMSYLFEDEKNMSIDGVEIDNKVIDIAREYFDLNIPNLNIYNEDGRIFTRFAKDKYDIILVDAYSNQIYIPWHMTTAEFFQDLRRILQKGGFVAMNINATSEDSELFGAITNTLAKVFPRVYSAPVRNSFNYLVFASMQEIDFEKFKQNQRVMDEPGLAEMIDHLTENAGVINFNPQKIVLTDDRAPIEHLTDFMYLKYVINEL